MNRFLKVLTLGTVLTISVFGADYKNLSTKEVREILNSKNGIVLDTRINDAFNGWPLDGMKKGGHIEGATDFSAHWFKSSADKKAIEEALKEAMEERGITKDKKVVLYDSDGGKSSQVVAKYLEKNGVKNISTYDLKEWEKEGLPLKSFPAFELLVPAVWVKENLKRGYKVFEVAWGPEEMDEDYKNGHIPGAIHIDTDEVESAPLWSINSDKDLLEFAKKNGITKDDKIILYSTNPMPSYRIAAILKYLGVSDVRVLNGGLNSWKTAGFPLEKKSNPKVAGKGFGAEKPLNKNFIIDIEEAKKIAESKSGQLVDIRSWDEHTGKITGYSDLDYKGRPAGAIWGKAGSNPNNLEDYRNIDNTMRNGNEILKIWRELGIDPKKNLALFCGSGWRAAEVLIFAKVLGVETVSLYSNGWYEWSSDSKNPVEIGEPKKK